MPADINVLGRLNLINRSAATLFHNTSSNRLNVRLGSTDVDTGCRPSRTNVDPITGGPAAGLGYDGNDRMMLVAECEGQIQTIPVTIDGRVGESVECTSQMHCYPCLTNHISQPVMSGGKFVTAVDADRISPYLWQQQNGLLITDGSSCFINQNDQAGNCQMAFPSPCNPLSTLSSNNGVVVQASSVNSHNSLSTEIDFGQVASGGSLNCANMQTIIKGGYNHNDQCPTSLSVDNSAGDINVAWTDSRGHAFINSPSQPVDVPANATGIAIGNGNGVVCGNSGCHSFNFDLIAGTVSNVMPMGPNICFSNPACNLAVLHQEAGGSTEVVNEVTSSLAVPSSTASSAMPVTTASSTTNTPTSFASTSPAISSTATRVTTKFTTDGSTSTVELSSATSTTEPSSTTSRTHRSTTSNRASVPATTTSTTNKPTSTTNKPTSVARTSTVSSSTNATVSRGSTGRTVVGTTHYPTFSTAGEANSAGYIGGAVVAPWVTAVAPTIALLLLSALAFCCFVNYKCRDRGITRSLRGKNAVAPVVNNINGHDNVDSNDLQTISTSNSSSVTQPDHGFLFLNITKNERACVASSGICNGALKLDDEQEIVNTSEIMWQLRLPGSAKCSDSLHTQNISSKIQKNTFPTAMSSSYISYLAGDSSSEDEVCNDGTIYRGGHKPSSSSCNMSCIDNQEADCSDEEVVFSRVSSNKHKPCTVIEETTAADFNISASAAASYNLSSNAVLSAWRQSDPTDNLNKDDVKYRSKCYALDGCNTVASTSNVIPILSDCDVDCFSSVDIASK